MLKQINDIFSWVTTALDDREKRRRKAIHIILYAIGISEKLKMNMCMKGGILLAIKYSSSRYTTDIDFSTEIKYPSFDQEKFKKELNESLLKACDTLPYGMSCIIQKFNQKPNKPNPTFPTFEISIGYADKSNHRLLRQLNEKRSVEVIKIDYSINEIVVNTDKLIVGEDNQISTYSFEDVFAEKIRALLQQKVRHSTRDQDVYDLYYLLTNFRKPSKKSKKIILESLILKSQGRLSNIDKDDLSDPEIIKKSKTYYEKIQDSIYGPLPQFEVAFELVNNFYKSLPWDEA